MMVKQLLVLVAFLSFTGFALARDANWAQPVALDGVPNFNLVAPNLYRSAQPTAVGFQALEKAYKLKTDLNLRESLTDAPVLGATKIKTFDVPMNAAHITDAQIVAALKIIRSAQSKGPVLVHCLHGSDRTGVVIAMYRIIYQGWSKQQAMDELKNGGFGFHSIFFNIPAYIKNADIDALKAALAKT